VEDEMAEQTQEPLDIEEPKKEEKVQPDVDGLLQTLSQFGMFGIEDPKALSGKLDAGTQAGRLAQLYGEEKGKRAELEARLKELESRPRQQARQDFDYDNYQEGQTIDIEAAIRKSVKSVINEEKETNRKLQEANLQRWNRINSDQNYGYVKDVWEAKLKDPNFSFKINQGLADPVEEYNNTVVDYLKTLLKQSHDTIQTIRGGPKEPPHVETGERSSANMVSETPRESDHEKNLKKLKEKADSGKVLTQEEELSIIDSIFTSPV